MGTDLTAGLSDGLDYVFAARPDDPEMRESVNVWLWDKGDEIGIPRIGIEAVAGRWHAHDVQVNIVGGDGRVFSRYSVGDAHDRFDARGRPTTLGAGPLPFECVEPFRHWRMRFDGLVHEWTCDEQITGGRPQGEPSVRVQVEVDMHSAVPPWQNGALLPSVKRILEEQDEGALIGGPRFEQLARTRERSTSAMSSTASTAAPCGSAVGESAGSARSGAMPGSRRCSRAAGRSATSCSRPATRRPAYLQRGLPVRRRRRADPGLGGRGAMAPTPSAPRRRGVGGDRVRDFDVNWLVRSAAERQPEIIGEAAGKLEELRFLSMDEAAGEPRWL